MKKILKILLVIIIIALGAVWLIFRDKANDDSLYLAYTETLERFETQSGHTMRYRDEGEGKAILLIHGVPTNSWMYRNLGDTLVAEGYRVIIPDLMGFGVSDRPTDMGMYDFENQAQDILDLMASLEISEWEQVTHDMGGLITWEMIGLDPEPISHLYVLNTIVYADHFNPPADFNYENKLHRWLLGLHAHPLFGKMIVSNMISSGTNMSLNSQEKAGYWLPLRSGAQSLVHFFTHTKDIKEQLPAYRSTLIDAEIPVTIIWGEDDPFLDSQAALDLGDELGLEKEQIIILEDTKHLIAESSYQYITNVIIGVYE